MKKIIPFILTFAIVFSLSVPFAFATGSSGTSSYWDVVVEYWKSLNDNMSGQVQTAFSGGGRSFDLGGFGKDSTGTYTKQKAQADYQSYVEDIPATVYSDDGSLYFQLPLYCAYYYTGSGSSSYLSTGVQYTSGTLSGTYFKNAPDQYGFTCYGTFADFRGTAPITGVYTRISSPGFSGYFTPYSGSNTSFTASWTSGNNFSYSAGDSITDTLSYRRSSLSVVYLSCSYSGPIFKVVPTGTLSDYASQTRAASISGDYGIIGNNNTVTNIGSQTIVNETNSSVYNPVTGSTTTYDSWTYDYSSRTYSLSMDDNSVTNTSTVEYGDENITITTYEGDTVTNTYTIYYLISDDSGSGSGGSGTGTGTGTGVSDEEAGQGIISRIATLLTTIMGGIWEVLKVFIQFLLDCLTDLFTMIAGFFTAVATIITDILAAIPGLFSGFLDFLALVFPFLPDDIITILTFGILAVVIIGIIKALRR